MTEHISYDCKCKLNSIASNSNQKSNNKTLWMWMLWWM